MDDKTRQALEASIVKWDKNTRVEKPEDARVDVADCPLCHLYFNDCCIGCPVSGKTGKRGCADTPYPMALNKLTAWFLLHGTRAAFIKAAKEEVEFLKTLRRTHDVA